MKNACLFILFVVAAVCCFSGVQSQALPSTEVTTSKVTATTQRAEVPCKNGRRLQGACIQRKFCDYGTPAIDKTVYGPPGYKSTCGQDEVCCPEDSILRDELNAAPKNDNDNFNEDG